MQVLRNIGYSVSYKILPQTTSRWQRFMMLMADAKNFRKSLDEASGLDSKIDVIFNSKSFVPLQIKNEWGTVLARLQLIRPKMVCEIGGAGGGTLAGLCEISDSEATIVSIDIGYSLERRLTFRRLARGRQTVHCWRANSHDPATLTRLRRVLKGQPLDFLLIDGDHTYLGVRKDFELFSPLIRPNGLVAIHDIVPDSLLRTGNRSLSDVGEVPVFWRELKEGQRKTWEIVEDWNQDGFGIGLVQM